ncbi:SubName: Full=Uncharacterized protein {ECO:0000313/EMBL:CCA76636.1}; Flags: Fragment [Serendipita indica DSM 11827]|nr:SubName: Full=Uncharacterized protein {ECO:0000313/EMBL:CCA76636.1}; Flags: Fragment [Serendipita indica DSM 11827]
MITRSTKRLSLFLSPTPTHGIAPRVKSPANPTVAVISNLRTGSLLTIFSTPQFPRHIGSPPSASNINVAGLWSRLTCLFRHIQWILVRHFTSILFRRFNPSQFLGVLQALVPRLLITMAGFDEHRACLTDRKVYDGLIQRYIKVSDDGHQMEDVAIKVIKAVGPRHSIQRRRRREVTIGKILQHPNVLPVHGIVEDRMFGPFGAIVTPVSESSNRKFLLSIHRCLNGNAAQYLHKHALHHWKDTVYGKAWSVVLFTYSHSPQIVHGDMKPVGRLTFCISRSDSMLLQCSYRCRWTANDLRPWTGSSCGRRPSSSSSGDGYSSDESREWMREINHDSAYGSSTRLSPYAHREDNRRGQIFHDIRCGCHLPSTTHHNDHGFSSSDILPSVDGIDALWNILELCWSRDPLHRPTASSLYEWLDTAENLIVDALQQAPDYPTTQFLDAIRRRRHHHKAHSAAILSVILQNLARRTQDNLDFNL